MPLRDDPVARFAVSHARRGFVWRDLHLVLLPDTQLFRRRARSVDPTFDAQEFGTKFLSNSDLEHLRDGLRKAGLLAAATSRDR